MTDVQLKLIEKMDLDQLQRARCVVADLYVAGLLPEKGWVKLTRRIDCAVDEGLHSTIPGPWYYSHGVQAKS